MDTFNWIESAGAQLDEEPRLLETPFGDGYAQRAPDGLNHIVQRWQVPFRRMEAAEGNALIDFLRAHGGHTPFDWTPLWHTAPISVVCKRWSRTQPDEWGITDISATFEQDFAP